MKRAHDAPGFPDSARRYLPGPGCRKVRRGDESRGADDGPPSPPSGSRRLTRRIAPRGGTVRAARSAKGARVMATPRRTATQPIPERSRRAPAACAEPPAAVDTSGPSDIVEKSKKVDISRGLQVSYQSSKAPFRVAPARSPRPAEVARRAPRTSSLPDLRNWHLARLSGAASKRPAPRKGLRLERASSVDPRSGMSLAGFAGTGALPRGSGGRGGRRRHERIRFGFRAAWLRARRDAAHLLHGCVRTRRHRPGA